MWILSILLFSLKAFSLEPFEKIKNIKILKVFPQNIILIERGLEDGINRNDHARFTSTTEEFGSRGICIKVSGTTSYWKLYRIPNPASFSLDLTYTLTGIADREIPFPEAELRDEIVKVDEEKKEMTSVKPSSLKNDLPQKLTERDLINASGPEERKLFVERTINKEKLERDFRDYRFSLYASPFSKQTINNAENYRYGFRAGNIASKYKALIQFDEQQSRLKDPETKRIISSKNTNGEASFIVNELSKGVSSLSLIRFNSNRFSNIYTPKYHWQVGFFGFTWNLYQKQDSDFINLSYIPLYDHRTTEVIDPRDKIISTVKRTGLRHGLKLDFKKKVNERVAIENMLWFRPYQEFRVLDQLDSNDSNINNDFKLIVNIAGNFFFDYNFIYQRDRVWKKLNNLSDTNIINSVNLRYDFEI